MKVKNILLCVCVFSGMVIFSSCVTNNEEELYPDETCDTVNVTYSVTSAPIINLNCLACHGAVAPSSGIPLEDYNQLKVKVEDGRLVGALKHQSGFSAMPQNGPKLPDCDILQIERWINNGAPDN